MGIQISPSILAADFADLAAEAARIPSADWLHVDVMDNHFVPEPDPRAARSSRRSRKATAHAARLPPDDRGPGPLGAGVRRGGRRHRSPSTSRPPPAPVRLARELRAQGARAGMALKPATPIEPYEDLLPELDMLLVMTVEPGFGGQKFLDLCLPKIRRARELIDKHGARPLAAGRRRGLAGDHRALRRGRRRRVRRRLGRLRRRRPRRDGRACARSPAARRPRPSPRGGRHIPRRCAGVAGWGDE